MVDIFVFVLHVIVHRIGRTGRCGNTGIATTFINKTVGK
jgi:superfamily II DNA/RNA helicase